MKLIEWYFWPCRWLDGWRQEQFTEPSRAFRADVTDATELELPPEWHSLKDRAEWRAAWERHAKRLKWSPKWLPTILAMYAVKGLWWALMAVQWLGPFALLAWWLSQHLAVTWRW